MEAKRRAVESLVSKKADSRNDYVEAVSPEAQMPQIEKAPPKNPHSRVMSTEDFGSLTACKALKRLAPQVGFEPTTLRLTAEFQGEAARSGKRKSLKTPALHSWSDAPFRMALKKSSYKSSYSQVRRARFGPRARTAIVCHLRASAEVMSLGAGLSVLSEIVPHHGCPEFLLPGVTAARFRSCRLREAVRFS